MTATLERSEVTLTLDGNALARAWLSVALASVGDKDRVALDHVVFLEAFDEGVRLAATDGYMILRSFVATGDAAEPGLDESPLLSAAARDAHGRAKSFMAYVLALTTGEDAPMIDVDLRIGAPDDFDQDALDGLQATLEIPGREALHLGVYEAEWVDWRPVLAGFKKSTTDAIALNPEIVGRIAKLAKLHGGAPLVWRFGGEDAMALVEVRGAEPTVAGAVMPMKLWDAEKE